MMAAQRHDVYRLGALIEGVAKCPAAQDCEIHGLCLDSRTAAPGDVFIALRGAAENGARFIHDAVAAGAVAVLTDEADAVVQAPVPVIGVHDLRRELGQLASRFYGHPSRELDVVAVTGTNGKTTVAHLVADALRILRGNAGYAGTLGIGLIGALGSNVNTTPDPVTLQGFLANLRDTGCTAAALEVSSHGIAQHRIVGAAIDVAVFTNLGHDHLDYHASLADYAATKKSLFRHPGLRHAVVNIDDPVGRDIAAGIAQPVLLTTYSLDPAGMADFTVTRRTRRGVQWHLVIATPAGEVTVETALPGDFNALNLAAALAALCALNIELSEAAAALSAAGPIVGRMERIESKSEDEPLVVVDYAHTPDSLERALAALRSDTRGDLVCVFGCGGDRDRSKRAPMGRVAAAGADRVFITNDNPRFEAAEEIIRDILEGIDNGSDGAVNVVEDRACAIVNAINSAAAGDTVLIAGKGHETVQETNGRRVPFSDAECARAALQAYRS